jgi:hypothetical protein
VYLRRNIPEPRHVSALEQLVQKLHRIALELVVEEK